MQLVGDAADNPDQRISEDIKQFIEGTLSIGVGLLSSIVSLASFTVILWGLSADAPLYFHGVDYAFPGYLFWGAVVYAIIGTVFTHLIGRPLVGLNFQLQRFEADFRFNLVRVRENSEQIALLQGEAAERGQLLTQFRRVVANWMDIMRVTKWVTFFTAAYSQAAVVLPFVLGCASLLRRQDATGRDDAGSIRVRQRAGCAFVLCDQLSNDCGMGRRGGSPRWV
jgi:vitamin B12/bleomycin/antimicrobial peptide transport system ATP-binding/permease protein